MRFVQIIRSFLFVQLDQRIGDLLFPSVDSQVYRRRRTCRIELPDVVAVFDQDRLVVVCPTCNSVRRRIIGDVVIFIPGNECLRSGQAVFFSVCHGTGVPGTILFTVPIGVFPFRREAHVGRSLFFYLPAFSRFQVDGINVVELLGRPHTLCSVRLCRGEESQFRISLIGGLQGGKCFGCKLEKTLVAEVVDCCVGTFQVGSHVEGLLGVLYFFVPAPDLYVRTVLC